MDVDSTKEKCQALADTVLKEAAIIAAIRGALAAAGNIGGAGQGADPTPENPDPNKAPPGTEWRGKPGSEPGGKEGNYYNPDTGESYRPDLDHEEPIGPHWDYRDPDGNWHRVFQMAQ